MPQPISLFKTEEFGEVTILTRIHRNAHLISLLRDNNIKFLIGRMCILSLDGTIKTQYESIKILPNRVTDKVLINLLSQNSFDIQDFSEFVKIPE